MSVSSALGCWLLLWWVASLGFQRGVFMVGVGSLVVLLRVVILIMGVCVGWLLVAATRFFVGSVAGYLLSCSAIDCWLAGASGGHVGLLIDELFHGLAGLTEYCRSAAWLDRLLVAWFAWFDWLVWFDLIVCRWLAGWFELLIVACWFG